MFQYKKLLIPAGIILATQLQGLTLKEATVQTLENNPAITERMKNYNATQQDVRIAKAGHYPTLDLQAGIGYQDISNSITGFEKKAQDIYETSLVFNQNLFNGLSTTYQVSTHEARLMGAAYSLAVRLTVDSSTIKDRVDYENTDQVFSTLIQRAIKIGQIVDEEYLSKKMQNSTT